MKNKINVNPAGECQGVELIFRRTRLRLAVDYYMSS